MLQPSPFGSVGIVWCEQDGFTLVRRIFLPRGSAMAGALTERAFPRAVRRSHPAIDSLARNPFPVVIPCHRAIREDGGLGGFQGGVAMKRTLLAHEGIRFTRRGRVLTEHIFY